MKNRNMPEYTPPNRPGKRKSKFDKSKSKLLTKKQKVVKRPRPEYAIRLRSKMDKERIDLAGKDNWAAAVFLFLLYWVLSAVTITMFLKM